MSEADWPMEAEDLQTFESLDAPTRDLVLRMLGGFGGPTEADHQALADHPQSNVLAAWLYRQPYYARARAEWAEQERSGEWDDD